MSSPNQLNLGLLLCDDVPKEGQQQYGNYTKMFRSGIHAVDENIELTAYTAYQEELPEQPQNHDGYIISGSSASVFEDKQWIRNLMAFVRQCYQQNIKVVGICFGHQLIAQALGGETIRSDNGWGFGIHPAKFGKQPHWINDFDSHYKLIVIHQDQVVDLPAGFDTVASNDFCPNSMITDNRLMLGIQGHPEFSKEYCAYRAEARRELIGEDKYQETLSLLESNETQSGKVLGWVSDFFRHA